MSEQERIEQIKKVRNFVNAVDCCLYCAHVRAFESYTHYVCVRHNFGVNKFSICDDFEHLSTDEHKAN